MSLKYRIALVIFILEGIMLTIVLTTTLSQSRNAFEEQQDLTHQAVLLIISEIASTALLTEEYADVQSYFDSLQKDPMIDKILLVNADNLTVVSTDYSLIGKSPPPFTNNQLIFWKTQHLSTAAGPLGILAVQFTRKFSIAAYNKSRNLGFTIALTGMGIIMIIGITVGYFLTRHLEIVTSAAREMAKGNLDAQSNIRGKDEIGLLGITFDNMAAAIKENQRKLAAQLKRNQLILETTQDGFCLITSTGNILETNSAFNTLFSLSPGTDTNMALLPFNNTQKISQMIATANEKAFVRFETTVTRSGEDIKYLDITLESIVDEGNTLLFGFLRDITFIREAELELKRYSTQLEKLVEERTAQLEEQVQIISQTHESVISTDYLGNIRTWNKGAEELFGYSHDDIIGQSIFIVLDNNRVEKQLNSDTELASIESLENKEIELSKKSGEQFFGHISVSRLKNKDQNNEGYALFIIDVTGRKKVEKLLRHRSQELETLNTELESFSYSVSHDLRAPLRSIDGFSQALSEEYKAVLDETGRDYLFRIRRAAQMMGQLIDDLLQLSRVTRSDLERSKTNLSKIAEEIVTELQIREPNRNVLITIEPDLYALCDARLAKIMLENLLGNAWKYTAKTKQAQISFSHKNINGEKVFLVADNGAGFEMKYAHKLYGAFQRLHRPEEFEGTGIGLATVKRIINRHGGKIWTEAAVNQGATFYFML